jgi:hypothetical protein
MIAGEHNRFTRLGFIAIDLDIEHGLAAGDRTTDVEQVGLLEAQSILYVKSRRDQCRCSSRGR